MKKGLIALAFGTFGLGMTEYVMMSILPDLAHAFNVTVPQAGLPHGAFFGTGSIVASRLMPNKQTTAAY